MNSSTNVINSNNFDFHRNEVVFTPPSKTNFKFKGMCLGTMPKVVLMIKMRKLVQHVASAVDIKKEETQSVNSKNVFLLDKSLVFFPYLVYSRLFLN